MIYIILAIGVFCAVFGAISYSRLRNREGLKYKIGGRELPREWVAFCMFLLGIFFVITFLIVEVEPRFYEHRSLQYPSNEIFHLIDRNHFDSRLA